MLVFMWVANLIRKILCNCWILLILGLIFAVAMVLGNRSVVEVAAELAERNGIVSGEQISNWGEVVNRTIGDLKGLIK
jgi:hypothetical protein